LSTSIRVVKDKKLAENELKVYLLFLLTFLASSLLGSSVRRILFFIPFSYFFIAVSLFTKKEVYIRGPKTIKFWKFIGYSSLLMSIFYLCQIFYTCFFYEYGSRLNGTYIFPSIMMFLLLLCHKKINRLIEQIPPKYNALYSPLVYIIVSIALLINISIIFPQVFKPRFTISHAVKSINTLIPKKATINYSGLMDLKRKDNKSPDYLVRTLWHEEDVINKYYDNENHLAEQVMDYKFLEEFSIYYPVIIHAGLPANNYKYTKIQVFKKLGDQ